MNDPLTSVIVPMRNAERYIDATLRALLAQAGIQLEIVVIDDGSTDNSAQIVRSQSDSRIRLIEGPRNGISAALNAGLEAVQGELVARCDADDLYPPGRMARQVKWLLDNPDYQAICGSFTTITPAGDFAADMNCGTSPTDITNELLSGKTRTHLGTFCIRTKALRQTGGFRNWFVTGEDIDLMLRLAETGKVYYDPLPCYAYRLHDASITHQQNSRLREFYESAARSFRRQRQNGSPDDLQQGTPPALPETTHSVARSSSEHLQAMMIGQAWKEHRSGNKRLAINTGWRACWMRPCRFGSWLSLVKLVIRSGH